jgi:hypothetical protein
VCGVSDIADAEHKCHAHKHLFVGRENCTTQITQFQLFVVASGDRFLGSIKRCCKGDISTVIDWWRYGVTSKKYVRIVAMPTATFLGGPNVGFCLHSASKLDFP